MLGARAGRSPSRVILKTGRPTRLGPIVASAILWGFLSNCSSPAPPPCYGVHVGDKIAITIVDFYDRQSTYLVLGPYASFTCGFGFDLVKGQELTATVVDSRADVNSDACTVGIIEIAPFQNWTWAPAAEAFGGSPDILVGEFRASNGSCQGALQITVVVTGTDPFAPSVQGQIPNVIMGRAFNAGSGTNCPMSCVGDFVVNLKKL
jgi:hypothetical protein